MNKNNAAMQKLSKWYASADKSIVRLVFIMVGVLIVMSILIPGRFFTVSSFGSMASQFPEFGILAIAMAITMITGGSDLSIVGIGNLVAVISGTVMIQMIGDGASDSQIWMVIVLSVAAGLLLGMVCGIFNGFCVSRLNIPPILTTLGTMQLFGGLGIVITKGTALIGFPEQFTNFGSGMLFGIIPYPLIVFIIVVGIAAYLIQRSKFGLRLYMMGTNAEAAKFSGINNNSMLIKTYMLSGILAAVAGLIILARTNSANADYGEAYILQTILVSIMGGVDPRGGKGKITGIVLAVITLQMLSSGLNMLNLSSYFKQLMYGGLLLVMVIANSQLVSEYFSMKKNKNHKALSE